VAKQWVADASSFGGPLIMAPDKERKCYFESEGPDLRKRETQAPRMDALPSAFRLAGSRRTQQRAAGGHEMTPWPHLERITSYQNWTPPIEACLYSKNNYAKFHPDVI